jgi:hypothetical protein
MKFWWGESPGAKQSRRGGNRRRLLVLSSRPPRSQPKKNAETTPKQNKTETKQKTHRLVPDLLPRERRRERLLHGREQAHRRRLRRRRRQALGDQTRGGAARARRGRAGGRSLARSPARPLSLFAFPWIPSLIRLFLTGLSSCEHGNDAVQPDPPPF